MLYDDHETWKLVAGKADGDDDHNDNNVAVSKIHDHVLRSPDWLGCNESSMGH